MVCKNNNQVYSYARLIQVIFLIRVELLNIALTLLWCISQAMLMASKNRTVKLVRSVYIWHTKYGYIMFVFHRWPREYLLVRDTHRSHVDIIHQLHVDNRIEDRRIYYVVFCETIAREHRSVGLSYLGIIRVRQKSCSHESVIDIQIHLKVLHQRISSSIFCFTAIVVLLSNRRIAPLLFSACSIKA